MNIYSNFLYRERLAQSEPSSNSSINIIDDMNDISNNNTNNNTNNSSSATHTTPLPRQNPCCVYDFTVPLGAVTGCTGSDLRTCITNKKNNIITFLKAHTKKWCFQLEQGESGYKHFQCRASFKIKKRLENVVSMIKESGLKGGHVSITSTENHTNMFYVHKDETRIDGPWADSDPVIPREYQDTPVWKPFQQTIIDWIDVYDGRCIDLIVDTKGNRGKSFLASYLSCHGRARKVPLQKEARDITRMIMNCPKVPMYFIDLPRSTHGNNLKTTYTAVESIKDGYAYDDRYHFKEEYFDRPRVVIFTNDYPPLYLLSIDRWRFWNIDAKDELISVPTEHVAQMQQNKEVKKLPSIPVHLPIEGNCPQPCINPPRIMHNGNWVQPIILTITPSQMTHYGLSKTPQQDTLEQELRSIVFNKQ